MRGVTGYYNNWLNNLFELDINNYSQDQTYQCMKGL